MLKVILLFLSQIMLFGTGLYQPFHTGMPHSVINTNSNTDYQIVYTNEGYTPDLLEIPIGSTVTFVNASDIPMWTASDPHPSHSDYPEFDTKRDDLRGEAFTFQFTKEGTFGFHNHEKSVHRGIIRVNDHSHAMPNIDKTLPYQQATREKMLGMLKQNDTSSIYTVIDAIEADYALSNDCHDMAHDIGHKAYEMFGFSGAMTFNDPYRLGHTSVDDICAGGYMHGILEELFLHQQELKNNPEPICSSIPDINRASCFHGVGHGLMFVTKRDIPASLGTCHSLKIFEDEHRCYEGVWMEMFWGMTEHAGADSLGWDTEHPLAKCMQAEDTEKPTCFLYAHLGYLRTHHHDFTGALDLCTKSGLNDFDAKFCIKGIGITMMKSVTSQHLERSEDLVKDLDYGKKYAYYEGVIGYARLSNVKETTLSNFCNSLKNDVAVCTAVLKTDP